jgi:DNA-binding beta-propeller fold protein YncE
MRRAFALFPLLASLALAGACKGSGKTSSTTTGAGGTVDPATFVGVPTSCAYQCPAGHCAEVTTPYACQNLGPWAQIPHDTGCEAWDGTYPTPAAGQCTASAPTGGALKVAGVDPDDATVRILPGGRRITPAGADFVFADPRTMTANVVPIAGTGFLLTVDLGYGDHIVRSVDPAQIAAQKPVLDQVNFADPEALNQGLAFSPPNRVFVAGAQGVVQALKIDTATGKLTRDDAGSVKMPPSPKSPGGMFYSSGVAVSADNTKLFVSPVKDTVFVVADVTAGAPAYGTMLGQVDLGVDETFNIYVDPSDPTTHFAYVTMWSTHQVLEVDVSNPAMPKVARSFAVAKDPQGMAFLDARWAVVGNDLGDSLSILDRTSGTVTTVPATTPAGALPGDEPSSLAFDPASKRLYVTQAGFNALAVYDVNLGQTPPTIAPAGRLPTEWWPSGVVVLGDGSLAVTSIMGHGTGPRQPQQEYELLRGGIQRIPAPSAADLTAGEAAVVKNNAVSAQSGYPAVQCPPGVSDFPIPPTNTGKPSPVIDHVIFVVRENKTFDGLLGDLPGVKGDPTLTLVPSPMMDGIWTNLRKLAKTFSHSDNFYTSAFISTQGHLWTTHGRSDDFNEREWWVTGYGRGLRGAADSGGVTDQGRPAEGSLFDWLGKNGVAYDILGEIVGEPSSTPPGHNPFDPNYPGGIIQSIGYPDVEKACYVAGRARVLCDLGNVVYMTLPNDHTQGLSAGAPTPETMFAVNDEATGMLVDAISHGPLWKRSLVVLVEDDPSMGGESVDYHRTILVMASPWIKRGYVSHSHVHLASVHKLIAHVFALPYPNLEVANAALPLDMFTSTPDYTPYTYEKRTLPLACGAMTSHAEERLTHSWDFDDADAQPGLDAQVIRWLQGRQLTELPPSLEREVAQREAARARREAREAQ